MSRHSHGLAGLPVLAMLACAFAAPRSGSRVQASTSHAAPRVHSAPSFRMPKLVAIDPRIAHRVNALRPSVKERLLAAVQRLPQNVTVVVTSACRTRSEQAHIRPTFGIKARPGHSAHEDGRAVDVNVLVDGERISPRENREIIGAAMAAEGFKGVRHDPVHYQLPKPDVDMKLAHGPDLEVMTLAKAMELETAAKEAAVVGAAPEMMASTPRALPVGSPLPPPSLAISQGTVAYTEQLRP